MPDPLTWTKDSVTIAITSDLLISSGFQIRVIVTREVKDEEIRNGDERTILNTLSRIEATALIDTGANGSVLRPELAESLHLELITKRSIQGLDGSSHAARVSLPTIWLPNLHRENISLAWATPAGADVLLGRDFLKAFSLIYDGVAGTATIKSKP
jgi:predicted aspartyl protease